MGETPLGREIIAALKEVHEMVKAEPTVDTREGRAALRELCEKATPGKWRANLHHTQIQAGRTYGFVHDGGVVPLAAITLGVEGMPQDAGRANAELIATARTALPAALDLLDARDEALEKAEARAMEALGKMAGSAAPKPRYAGSLEATRLNIDYAFHLLEQRIAALEARLARLARVLPDDVRAICLDAECKETVGDVVGRKWNET